MKYQTEHIRPPPIVELGEVARRYSAFSDYINLGQGLPGHVPPAESLKLTAEQFELPYIHQYTADHGLIDLREDLSLYLRGTHSIDVDPEKEVVITGGANQALLGAVLTIVGVGDEVVMPSPYYFNSVMAVQLCRGHVAEVPLNHEFQPMVDEIAKAIRPNTRAVLLVTPNNPTGAVYDQRAIDEILDICVEHDIILISDETYSRMVFEDARHYSPATRRDLREHVVMIGSFSKIFGMSGWRVGFVVGSERFIQEYLKVHDTMAVCAPAVSQVLALDVLRQGSDFVERELKRLERLREHAYMRLARIDGLECVRTKGTFYLFPRIRDCKDSRRLTLDLLAKAHLLLLPGSIFGAAGEGHVRISIGHLTPEVLDDALDRLERYLGH
ncbi:MAG: pyridoxal phosphate-dependent aminotransferase [Candidatus Thorarchaeota archaeon]|nr:pyridoxal phosphate-dependent aminotransferase [Candidatus Thorarchaeota archaeon]